MIPFKNDPLISPSSAKGKPRPLVGGKEKETAFNSEEEVEKNDHPPLELGGQGLLLQPGGRSPLKKEGGRCSVTGLPNGSTSAKRKGYLDTERRRGGH